MPVSPAQARASPNIAQQPPPGPTTPAKTGRLRSATTAAESRTKPQTWKGDLADAAAQLAKNKMPENVLTPSQTAVGGSSVAVQFFRVAPLLVLQGGWALVPHASPPARRFRHRSCKPAGVFLGGIAPVGRAGARRPGMGQ